MRLRALAALTVLAAVLALPTQTCEGVGMDRSYDETAVLQALLASGHDLSRAEVADVSVGEPEGDQGRIRVVLDWRLPRAEIDRLLADSVRFEANACS
jgi:hypothetical protein